MKAGYCLLLLCGIPMAYALWPMPRSLQTGASLVKLSPSFDIEVALSRPPQDLLDAVTRTKQNIKSDMLRRLVVGRGSSDTAGLAHAPSLSKLSLTLTPAGASSVNSIMTEATKDIAKRREEYSLTLPANGATASIVANSTLGLFRGLTTFEQLWYADSAGNPYAYQAPVVIASDTPAYVGARLVHLVAIVFQPIFSLIAALCWTLPGICELLASRFKRKPIQT